MTRGEAAAFADGVRRCRSEGVHEAGLTFTPEEVAAFLGPIRSNGLTVTEGVTFCRWCGTLMQAARAVSNEVVVTEVRVGGVPLWRRTA